MNEMAQCGRAFEHSPHGGPTATRDASCDGRLYPVQCSNPVPSLSPPMERCCLPRGHEGECEA